MTYLAFTPGPWNMTKHGGMSGRYHKFHIGSSVYSKDGMIDGRDSVAEIQNNPEAAGNALLVAAAPDLYAALKELEELGMISDSPAAVAAIAKAEGQSNEWR